MQEQILRLTVERARSCPGRCDSSYGKRLLKEQNPGPVGVSGQVGHLTLTIKRGASKARGHCPRPAVPASPAAPG